mgnify:CR=1 FL=1
MEQIYDVAVLGGGPGGYTAALYCARAGLSTVVLEKLSPGGQMATTSNVENYPGFAEGVDGFDLAMQMKDGAERFGVETLFADATAVALEGGVKTITTSSGERRARTVILATGADPRPLGVPHEDELRGRGVAYCATCDGMLYRGRAVAVWGLSPEAPQEANFLHGIGCSVTYIAGRRPDTLDAGVAFRAGRVEAVEGGAAVEAVRVGGAALPVQGVFILRAATPPDALVPGLALENGFVKTDAAMRTNIPGLFAAGDMTGKPLQVANAVGDGLVAALAAVDYLDGVSPMTD